MVQRGSLRRIDSRAGEAGSCMGPFDVAGERKTCYPYSVYGRDKKELVGFAGVGMSQL